MNPQPIKGPLDDPWSRMMTASIAGDEGAYRRLLEDIGRSVRAMARGAFARAGVGDADVEDAVQETLLAIHLKRHTWDPEQPLAPWVYAIARHKVVDALRRRGRRKVEPLENFEEFLAAPEAEDPHALSDARKLLETLGAAPARHRDLDLPRRPIDRRDGEAPVDVRGRGQGGAPSRAQVARRGLAEVGRVKTSELIAALAADPVPEPIRLGRRVALALAVGLAGSVALYCLLLGPRPDVAAAADTMRFWLKFVDSFAFALPTLLLTLRLARPDAKPRALALWLLAPFILLAAGVIVELLVVPQSEWMSRLMGATAMHCTVTIPMLAAPVLAALIVALRAGAPLHPALTGALAGAAAAGVGALVYASSCPGDSPLFVATWYPLATLICMGVGALAGRRFLAW